MNMGPPGEGPASGSAFQQASLSGQLQELVQNVATYADAHDDVRTAFVTGSFVTGLIDASQPNLNVYFIASEGRAIDLRLSMADFWQAQRLLYAERGVGIFIDTHPYTITWGEPPCIDSPALSITTKILSAELRDERYWMGRTIGPGWSATRDDGSLPYIILTGDARDLEPLAAHPERNEEWIDTVVKGLTQYHNVLAHLPTALPDDRHFALLYYSSFYAEEAFKDILAVRLSAAELVAGRHVDLLSGWGSNLETTTHVKDRYGDVGLEVRSKVLKLKQQRTGLRQDEVTRDLARLAWRISNEVNAWAFSLAREVAEEIAPGKPGLTRQYEFV